MIGPPPLRRGRRHNTGAHRGSPSRARALPPAYRQSTRGEPRVSTPIETTRKISASVLAHEPSSRAASRGRGRPSNSGTIKAATRLGRARKGRHSTSHGCKPVVRGRHESEKPPQCGDRPRKGVSPPCGGSISNVWGEAAAPTGSHRWLEECHSFGVQGRLNPSQTATRGGRIWDMGSGHCGDQYLQCGRPDSRRHRDQAAATREGPTWPTRSDRSHRHRLCAKASRPTPDPC